MQHEGGVINFNRKDKEMIIQLLEEPTYLYFDQIVMKVYQLPIRYTVQLSAVEVYNVRHPQGVMSMSEREVDLWFRDAHYNTIGDLLKYINKRNERMFKYHVEKFGIAPAYFLDQAVDSDNVVITTIVTHLDSYRFECDCRIDYGYGIIEKTIPVFSYADIKEDDRFGAEVLVKMHNSIIKNQVIKPTMYKSVYTVRMGDLFARAKIETRDIESGGGRVPGFHLHFLSHPDRCVFDYYHIRYSDFAYVIPHSELVNGIPVGPEEDIRRLINYINMTYCICESSGFRVDDNIISCNKRELEITQTRSGKWYVKGDVLVAFGLDSMETIRKAASDLFGKKRMNGVFPECDSKEDLLRLVEVLRKYR